MRTATLLTILALASRAAAAEPPAGYHVRTLKGFTLLVQDAVLQQSADRWQRRPLDVLETEFDDLKRVMAPKHLELLRQVPVFVTWDTPEMNSGVVAVYRSGVPGRQRGPDDAKINCIEILTLKRLGELRPPGSTFQQIVTLHEMAHAIHHRLLGFDNPEVIAAFQQAVDRRLYDEVSDRLNRRGRAYARTNANEYFAEISCAYLDSCFYYPFTFSDLKQHDPAGFALAEAVWKHPERFAGRKVTPVETPHYGDPRAATHAGTNAELAAFAQLDRARAFARDGKTDEARRTAEAVLKNYPATIAAGDARKLLDRLK